MKRVSWVVPALALAYAGAAALYGWQAWSQPNPWIFPDETLHTRAAQAITGTGSAGVGPVSGILSALIVAPAWLFHDPVTAYAAAKLIGVFVMCLVVVPAYLLARLFTGRVPAVWAAVASLVIPAMSYSSLLMQEPFAYPYATLVLYVLASGIKAESRIRLAVAFVLALIGPLLRPELVVLPIVVLLAIVVWIWFTEPARERRAAWTLRNWLVLAAVVIVVLAAVTALGAAVSVGWRTALQHPGDVVRYAALALGPFAAGIAILPVLAAPAVLTRTGAFTPVFASAGVAFLMYVGAKEAFLATQPGFSTTNDLLGERNLIYLSPLCFAAVAIWAARRRVAGWGLASATAVLVATFAWIPYVFADPSAPSSPTVVSIARIAGGASHSGVRGVLIALTLVAAAVLASPRAWRAPAFAAFALIVVGWSLTGEINASTKSREIGRALADAQPRPLDWIDRATRGVPAVYVGQAKLRAPEILSLAFWNDSLQRLVTLGGEPVYGLIFETKIASADGRLSDPSRADYAVSDKEVGLAGQHVASGKRWNLQRIDGPVHVTDFEAGIWQDGWQEERSAYARFTGAHGHVRVALSQQYGCGATQSSATVRVVALASRRITAERGAEIPQCRPGTSVTVPVPRAPFAVRTTVSPTFTPGPQDPRHLGAVVSYRYFPTAP